MSTRLSRVDRTKGVFFAKPHRVPRFVVHPVGLVVHIPSARFLTAARLHSIRPAQPPPEPALPPRAVEHTTRTTTIRNHVNLKKDSLRLVFTNDEIVSCAFTFDANLPCWLSVFVVARDAPRDGSRLTLTGNRPLMARVKRDAGLGQTAEFRLSRLDVAALLEHCDRPSPDRESTDPSDQTHALIVRLECVVETPETRQTVDGGSASPPAERREAPPEPSGSALDYRAQAQTTFCDVKRVNEDGSVSFASTVTKQKIWVDGISYELQEIFGIEHCSTGTPLGEDGAGDDSGKECVVCMSEPRDTTALPCRHMCMCGACARMLRGQSNRCPICRTPVESLLEIKVAAKEGE